MNLSNQRIWQYRLEYSKLPQTPLRPIVSCINAPSYKLSKYIASVICPLTGKTSSHVLNSKHFAGMVKEEHVKAEETLVSFDVISLFTNVPMDEAVDVIHRKLAEEEEEENLVERTPLPAERIAELLPGISLYRRRTCGRKRSTSPLLSSRTVIPCLTFMPYPPPYRNHQHHQRRSPMRNQMMRNPRRKRRGSNHWQSSHT